MITQKENQPKEIFPFYARSEICQNEPVITELNIGNCKLNEQLPQLPNPTGEFNIGQAIFFYQKSQTSVNRTLSFQVWFPTSQTKGEKMAYRSSQTAATAANFLGWPLFANSFVTLIKSNSFKNAVVASGEKFPVLIYNHGYGGFSGVYQTVFEELASHGYIVVSIGHQNESALLMVNEKIVIPNSPENEFYTKRAYELNGGGINELQSILLNSDDDKKVKDAYEKLLQKSPLHKESVELWTKDTKEIILKLGIINRQDERLKGAFDLDKIGAFGHSVGGATAGELSFSCPEVKAGINLDGFQFGNLIHNKLQVPFLFVSSNSTGETFLRISPFRKASEHPCHHAIIRGFSHDMFSDLPVILNGNERAILIQRSIILHFFDQYLKGDKTNITLTSELYPEVSYCGPKSGF